MGRKIYLILSILMAFVSCISVSAEDGRAISVYVDSKKVVFDSEPYLSEAHTMVPMRAVMEALGATVSWEENNKTATAVKNSVITKFSIGSHDYYKNGGLEYMPVAAVQLNNRTYVPLRAISESFGFKVDWDGDTDSVYITSENKSDPEENIYYIKGSKGGYLTYSDGSITSSAVTSPEAMWALESVDAEQKLFRIYTMSDLYNPLGMCSHIEEIAENEKSAEKVKNTKKSAENKTEEGATEETSPEEALRICSVEKHLWVIKEYNGKYIICPKDSESSALDADNAGVTPGNVALELIPCV